MATPEQTPTSEEMASLRALPVLRLDSPMMRGAVVLSLQIRLNKRLRDQRIREDSIFGVETWSRVKDFQEREGLPVDGWVGPATWMKLLER